MKAVQAFIVTLIIVILAGSGFMLFLSRTKDKEPDISISQAAAVEEANNQVSGFLNNTLAPMIEDAVANQLEQAGLTEEKAREIAESIDEEDKAEIIDIAANHVEDITEVAGYITSNDIDSLDTYLEENLTDEEKEKLQDIIVKYVSP